MGILIASFTILMILRDAVLDPKYRDRFLLKYIPELGGRTWLIIGLVALILLILESGYNKADSDKRAFRERYKLRVRELGTQHQAALTSAGMEELLKAQRSISTDGEEQMEMAQIEARHISRQELEKEYELRKLEPNLVYLGGKVVDVYESEHEIIVEGVLEQARNFRVATLSYRNSPHAEPKRKLGVINDVSAEITYKSFDGLFSLNIHRGAWLGEKDNRVNFGKNDKHDLIIAILDGTADVYAVERSTDSARIEGFTKRVRLAGNLFNVRVRLIIESDGTTFAKYDLVAEVTREPEFKVKLIRLQHWKIVHLMKFGLEGHDLWHKINIDEKKEEEIAEEVKDWESRAANFIGKHLSEQQKISFLNSYPSIEDGLQRKYRLSRPRPFVQGKEAQIEKFTPKNWTLSDSITVRQDKLREFADRLHS